MCVCVRVQNVPLRTLYVCGIYVYGSITSRKRETLKPGTRHDSESGNPARKPLSWLPVGQVVESFTKEPETQSLQHIWV